MGRERSPRATKISIGLSIVGHVSTVVVVSALKLDAAGGAGGMGGLGGTGLGGNASLHDGSSSDLQLSLDPLPASSETAPTTPETETPQTQRLSEPYFQSPTPENSPEDRPIRLGISSSKQDTDNWIGYDTPTEHAARKSTVAQPALDPLAGAPLPLTGLDPELAPGRPGSPLGSEDGVLNEAEGSPAPSSRAEAPGRPATSASTTTSSTTSTTPGSVSTSTGNDSDSDRTDGPLVDGEREDRPQVPREIPRPVPEPKPAPEPAPVIQPDESLAPDPEAPAPPELQPTPPAPPTPGSTPDPGSVRAAAPKPGADTSDPAAPGDPATVGSESARPANSNTQPGHTGGVRGDGGQGGGSLEQRGGERSESEADASSLEDALVIIPGRPAAAEGLEIITKRPVFSRYTRTVASPANPVYEVTFNRSGRVIKAVMLRSSGFSDVDDPVYNALLGWKARGDRLALLPQNDSAGLTITIQIVLR